MKKISFLFGMLATCITLQAAVEEISVSRALKIISALADGASTTEQYIVKGVVSEIITTDEGLVTYKNCDFWMRDSDNATLKLKAFRTKGIDGAAFTVGLIAVGDTVRVQGVLMNYVNTTTSERFSEIYKGKLVEVVAGNTGGIYYNFDDANLTATVTYCGSSYSEYTNEYTGDVVIPATVTSNGKTYSVTSIGSYAFRACSGLTSVTIPNSVTSIGQGAFSGCSGLTSIIVESGNTKYDSRNNCNAIIETATNTLIAGCQSTTIPNSVTSIGMLAFWDCSGLTSVTIPNSVTSIGGSAFRDCSGLTSVVWNAKNCADFAEYYDEYAKKYYYGPFCNIVSKITSFTFGDEVEHIPAYLCYGMENLTSVTIPNSITSIGGYAFYNCSGLTSVTIPNSVTSIEHGAFYNCSGLTSVTIGNSVESIGSAAFQGCSNITSVVWNAKNCADFNSDSGPFYKICLKITSFMFGDEVEYIPAYLCYGMVNLTSITIPNSVTSIGYRAFMGCSGLTSVVWNAKNCVIGADDDAPIILNDLPFYDIASQITSFTFGNEVEHIPADLCYGMSNLTSVTIGNSVESIGVWAFEDCTKLINIVCYAAEPPSCDASAFANYNVFLKVPCDNLMAYQTHVCWGSFKYISCIGSDEVQVTEFSVTPSTNEAQFTWPAEPNAATYELVISKDGVVFCTLTFNASGQLMGIAFAPSANAPAAAPTTSGFQFTVTGLVAASHYTYTFDAKDAGGNVIKHYAGEFNTEGSTVGLEQIELSGLYTQAGRIVCEGDFRIYDLLGRDVTRLNGSLCGVYVVKSGNAAVKVVVK